MKKLIIISFAVFYAAFNLNAQELTLEEALGKEDTIAIKAALKNGGDINAPIGYAKSPAIHQAVRWNDIEFTRFLIRNGANVEEPRTAKGRTCLIISGAYYSGPIMGKILIDAGAKVNSTDNAGNTALMLAASNYKADYVKFLLDNGADPNLKNSEGKTALDIVTETTLEADLVNSMKDMGEISKEKTIEILKAKTK